MSRSSNPSTSPHLVRKGSGRPVWWNGSAVAVGFLFLFLLTMSQQQELIYFPQVLTISIVGVIGGVAALIVGVAMEPPVRSILQTGIGSLLFILTMVLSRKINLSMSLDVLYGNQSGLIASGCLVSIIALGTLNARIQRPESILLRYILGGAATLGLSLFVVQGLVWIGGEVREVLPVFSRGDAIDIAFVVILLLLFVAILSVAATGVMNTPRLSALGSTAAVLGWVIAGLIAAEILTTAIRSLSGEARPGRILLNLIRGLFTGALPLTGSAHLVIVGLSSLLIALLRPISRLSMAVEPQPPLQTANMPRTHNVRSSLTPMTANDNGDEDNIARRLRHLYELNAQGLITDAELQEKRKQLLSQL